MSTLREAMLLQIDRLREMALDLPAEADHEPTETSTAPRRIPPRPQGAFEPAATRRARAALRERGFKVKP